MKMLINSIYLIQKYGVIITNRNKRKIKSGYPPTYKPYKPALSGIKYQNSIRLFTTYPHFVDKGMDLNYILSLLWKRM